jgi:hypothetical protein
MPAKSKAQQRLFGMVDSLKKGTLKHPSAEVKKVAKGMSRSTAREFAKTKRSGLPNRVSQRGRSH